MRKNENIKEKRMKLEPSRFYYLQQKVRRTVKRVREKSKIKEEEKDFFTF
jgi:hypothetical protein